MPQLSTSTARGRFASARVARLATADDHSQPHLVPVVFVLVAGSPGPTVYSAVDAKPKRTTALRRLANVRVNPHASLLVDHYADDWSALWWVRADGRARIVEANCDEGAAAVDLLARKYPQHQQQRPGGPVLAVDVTRWVSWSATPEGQVR